MTKPEAGQPASSEQIWRQVLQCNQMDHHNAPVASQWQTCRQHMLSASEMDRVTWQGVQGDMALEHEV